MSKARDKVELCALRALHEAGFRDPMRNQELVGRILAPALTQLFAEASSERRPTFGDAYAALHGAKA